ncbi:MAG: hydroxymethylglutaryl-CoA lyase [Erysipelotrichaceae bacterium]|nr:hydroxymethylglutaryl-CoA lyase [Erysipelotrichaceae bacterium]
MSLPKVIEIMDVCPRDGFQNVKDYIEFDHKIAIIQQLIIAGSRKIEMTSFVNPKWIPQMTDAVEVTKKIRQTNPEALLVGLVPNSQGVLEGALAGIDQVTYVISVSEAHNKANVNRTTEESFQDLEEIMYKVKNVQFRLALATSFGCPFNEEIKVLKIINMIKRAIALGCIEISIADTIGSANPVLVKSVLGEVAKEIPLEFISIHIHDTRGMGLLNIYTAMELGFYKFETSAGGLGGCPFAPGAAGNVATEDLVNLCNSIGVQHNIDESELMKAVEYIREYVKAPINSHMAAVCKLG